MRRNTKANPKIVVVALALSILAPRSMAQAVTGLDLFRQIGDAKPVQAFTNSNLFHNLVHKAWRSAKPQADKAVENAIGDNNRHMPHGVTIYHQHSSLTTDPEVETTIVDQGRTIAIRATFRNNVVEFHSTTPTAAGKYADPKMSVDYDLEIDATIPIPNVTGPIACGRVTAQIRNAKLDSHNLSGDLALAATRIIRFFGGPDFKAAIERKIDREQDFTAPLNAALEPLNQTLRDLASQGFSRLVSRADPNLRRLILQAVRPR